MSLATTNSWRYLCHGSSATTAAYSPTRSENLSCKQWVTRFLSWQKKNSHISQPIDIQHKLAATIEAAASVFLWHLSHSPFIKHTHQYNSSSRKNDWLQAVLQTRSETQPTQTDQIKVPSAFYMHAFSSFQSILAARWLLQTLYIHI